MGDTGRKHGNHTIANPIFKGCDPQAPGVHRSRTGCIQRSCHTGGQGGFHLPYLPLGQHLQPRYTVGQPIFQLLPKSGQGFFIIGHHQGAASAEGHIQFPAQCIKVSVSGHGHGRLAAAGPVVIACIHNGAVGSGDPGANIRFFFQQDNGQLPPHQAPGDKAAQNPPADDRYIRLFHRQRT